MTREQIIASVRAEIEREGIHVAISDDELWEALISPLRSAYLEHLRGLARLGVATRRTNAALERLLAALDA